MNCSTLPHLSFESRHVSGACEVVLLIQMVALYNRGHVFFPLKTETGWVGGVQKHVQNWQNTQ